MDSGALLDLLGNANRRRILRLLAARPCYVTEISEYLGVSPKAVIDHLERLEDAGLVASRTDDRRRKYFSITRNLRLEVQLSPYEFGTKSAYPTESIDVSTCRYVSVEVDRADERGPDGGDGVEDADAAGQAVADGVGTQTPGADVSSGAPGDGVTSDGPSDATRTDAPPAVGSDVADGRPDADDESPGPDAESADLDGEGSGLDGEGPGLDGEGPGLDGEGPDREPLAPLARELARFERLTDELSLAQRWAQGRATELRERIGEAVDGGDGLGRLAAGLICALADGPADVARLGRAVDAPPSVVEETLEALAAEDVVQQDGDRWRLKT